MFPTKAGQGSAACQCHCFLKRQWKGSRVDHVGLKAKSFTNPPKGWKLSDLWSPNLRSHRLCPAGLRCSSISSDNITQPLRIKILPCCFFPSSPIFPQTGWWTLYYLCLPCNSHLPGDSEKSPTNHVHYLGPFLAAEDKKAKGENNCTLLSLSMKAFTGPSSPFCIASNILNTANPFSDTSQTAPCLH